MYLKFVLLVILLGSVINQSMRRKVLAPFIDGPTKELFKAYHLIYQKEYELNSEEGIRRYRIFKSNLAFIKEENSRQSKYKLGINNFADMTEEERNKNFLPPQEGTNNFSNELGQLSTAFLGKQGYKYTPGDVKIDWTLNMHPTIRLQRCGSCYADATLASIEGNYNIKTGTTQMFSTQQILDCEPSNLQCSGGEPDKVMTYLKDFGVALESDYPNDTIYQKKEPHYPQQNCRYNFNKGQNIIKDFINCSEKTCTMDSWVQMLQDGPTIVLVDGLSPLLEFYESGIADLTDCKMGNHVVVAVALLNDGDGKGDYIKIRNSWGEDWGENGYARVRVNAKDKTCFITSTAILPMVTPPGPTPHPPENSYEIWSKCNYVGTALYSNFSMDSFKPKVYMAKSIKLNGNIVTLYPNMRCFGKGVTFTEDEPCLATSLDPEVKRIAALNKSALVRNPAPAQMPADGCVKVYNDACNLGKNQQLCTDTSDFGKLLVGNNIKSILFGAGVKCVTLYAWSDFTGKSATLCGDSSQFGQGETAYFFNWVVSIKISLN